MSRSMQKNIAQKWSLPIRAGALVIGCVASACDESGPRVFSAQRYRPELGCVETYAPLALVEAEDLGSGCDRVCFQLDEELYVSSVCPPYPAQASMEAAETAGCSAALAAPDCETTSDGADAGDGGP